MPTCRLFGVTKFLSQGRGVGQAAPGDRRALAHLDAEAAPPLHGGKADFVGDVVADEDGGAAGERGLGQEVLDRMARARAARLGFHDHLAALQGDAGRFVDGLLHRLQAVVFQLGRQPVVQRQRAALVLHQQARVACGHAARRRFHVVQRMGVEQVQGAVGAAPLGPVHAGDRELQRVQEGVELLDGAAGDDGHRALQVVVQVLQHREHGLGHVHGVGLRRDVHHGPVEVEEQGAGGIEDLRKRHARPP
jgi:hypothetical protein